MRAQNLKCSTINLIAGDAWTAETITGRLGPQWEMRR